MDKKSGRNEGEGNKTADQNYRKGVEQFLKDKDPQKLARQAEQDIAKDKGKYDEAERVGKSHIAEEDPEVKR